MTKLRILITNDDGIYAPGIRHLWRAVAPIADVIVCAPTVEQSASGLAITIRNPLQISEAHWGEGIKAWSVNGTPADCVKIALHALMDSPPDLVVSGINRGTNAGRNLLYSGTVAGAIEAVLHDIPAIAFSCCDFFNPDYSIAEKHVPLIVEYILTHPLPQGGLLNVNFPTLKSGEMQGFKLTRQGKEYWAEDPDARNHPVEGSTYYWLGGKHLAFDEHEDSDIVWLKKGYATAVPIQISELTDHPTLQKQRSIFEEMCSNQNVCCP